MTYKLSLYNNIIRINNSHTILFNSYNMESILLKNCILEDGEELKRKMKSDKLLYNQLLETGMLVPEEKNEVEELELRIQSGQNNSDHFILHINPTLDCNFNCWYCYENHIESFGVIWCEKKNIRDFRFFQYQTIKHQFLWR